jgi:hypothetical protein
MRQVRRNAFKSRDMNAKPFDSSVSSWREWAKADAERRGLPQLAQLIDGLSVTVARLRVGDWNDDASRGSGEDGQSDADR